MALATTVQPAITVQNGLAYFAAHGTSSDYWLGSWNGSSAGPFVLTNLGGQFASDPAITASRDGMSLYLVARDAYNGLWSGQYYPNGYASNGYTPVFQGWGYGAGVSIQGQPSITSAGDSAAYAGFRDTSNGLWLAHILGNTAWTYAPGGGNLGTDPQVVGSVLGTIYATFRDSPSSTPNSTGAVWYETFSGGSTPQRLTTTSIGGSFIDIAATFASNALFIGARDGAKSIWWYTIPCSPSCNWKASGFSSSMPGKLGATQPYVLPSGTVSGSDSLPLQIQPGYNIALSEGDTVTLTAVEVGTDPVSFSTPSLGTLSSLGGNQWLYTAPNLLSGPTSTSVTPTLDTVQYESVTFNLNPRVASVLQPSPGNGAGSGGTFTFTITDPNGYADVNQSWILFAPTGITDPTNGSVLTSACAIVYDYPSGTLNLMTDNSSYPDNIQFVSPSGNTLQNSQCSFPVTNAINVGGNLTTITLPITFNTSTFGQTHQIFQSATFILNPPTGWDGYFNSWTAEWTVQ